MRKGPRRASPCCWPALLMTRGALRLLLCVAALAPSVLAANQIKGLDDAILFRLNWGGAGGGGGLLVTDIRFCFYCLIIFL